MGKRYHLVGIVSSLFVCWAAEGAFAETAAPPAKPVRDPKVSDIVVPSTLGYIVETHDASAPSQAPLIVHIQEAHTNYEGQKNMVSILERLIKEQGLKLILVEGGHGDVGLAYLRAYGFVDNRRQVAEKYLKAGIISGEEYLDIVSEYPLTLWGIEQPELYQKNFETFLDVETMQTSVRPTLAAIQQAVDTLAARLADPVLTELEAKAKAFERKEIGLAQYAQFLDRQAIHAAIPESAYPSLKQFLSVHQLEAAVDLQQVPKEQRALVQQLSTRVEPKALDALVEQARQLKAGTITQEVFYHALEQTARTAGADLTPYPNLSRYFAYLNASADLKPSALAQELEPLAIRIRQALASTPERRRLAELRDQLDLVTKLVELQLTPPEYARLQALPLEGLCAGWTAFLNEQSVRQGMPSSSVQGMEALQAALPRLVRFYESARARDQALANNAMAKLEASHERIAVLITGGFHSPQVTQLLKARGASLVVIAPRVSEQADEGLYQAVVKYKSGRGSYDEVMSIANQMPTRAASR